MDLPILVIRRETRRAFQVITEDYQIVWLPKKAVNGEYRAGERDIVMDVKLWFLRILEEQEYKRKYCNG